MFKYVKKGILLLSIIVMIIGCGSNSETDTVITSDDQNITTKIISGYVIDDPIVQARISVYDINNNLLANESNLTDNTGKYEIKVIKGSYEYYILKADGGFIGETSFKGELFAIIDSNNTNANLTPLTTILYKLVILNNDTNFTEKLVSAKNLLIMTTGLNENELNSVDIPEEDFNLSQFRLLVKEKGFDDVITLIVNDIKDGKLNDRDVLDLFNKKNTDIIVNTQEVPDENSPNIMTSTVSSDTTSIDNVTNTSIKLTPVLSEISVQYDETGKVINVGQISYIYDKNGNIIGINK